MFLWSNKEKYLSEYPYTLFLDLCNSIFLTDNEKQILNSGRLLKFLHVILSVIDGSIVFIFTYRFLNFSQKYIYIYIYYQSM